MPADLVWSCKLCGLQPCVGHVHVGEDVYFQYIYCVLKSMIDVGIKNIYCIPQNQTEEANLMPMTIACQKAAKRIAMEYMEETRGKV